jgi:hypothetical protein
LISFEETPIKPILRTTTLAIFTVLFLSWHNQGLAQQTEGEKLVNSKVLPP